MSSIESEVPESLTGPNSPRLRQLGRKLLDILLGAQERARQRAILRETDARMLRDMGLSHRDIARP